MCNLISRSGRKILKGKHLLLFCFLETEANSPGWSVPLLPDKVAHKLVKNCDVTTHKKQGRYKACPHTHKETYTHAHTHACTHALAHARLRAHKHTRPHIHTCRHCIYVASAAHLGYTASKGGRCIIIIGAEHQEQLHVARDVGSGFIWEALRTCVRAR
jgi:hypothetical protein